MHRAKSAGACIAARRGAEKNGGAVYVAAAAREQWVRFSARFVNDGVRVGPVLKNLKPAAESAARCEQGTDGQGFGNGNLPGLDDECCARSAGRHVQPRLDTAHAKKRRQLIGNYDALAERLLHEPVRRGVWHAPARSAPFTFNIRADK